MVITPVAQKGIDIKLPETQQAGDQNQDDGPKGIVLTIEKDRTIKINTIQTSFDLLSSELTNIYSTRADKKIFIRADSSVGYGEVLKAIDIAKGAGIEVLGVVPTRYESE
jgi:biopolymer transport protein ExbD